MKVIGLLSFLLVSSLVAPGQDKLYSTKSASPHNKAVAYSPDDRFLVAASDDKIYIWYSGSENLYGVFDTDLSIINTIVFDPSGDLIYAAGKGKLLEKGDAIEVWHVAEKNKIKTFTGHEKEIKSISVAPATDTI